MKSVVRIQRHGKVNDVGPEALATMPTATQFQPKCD